MGVWRVAEVGRGDEVGSTVQGAERLGSSGGTVKSGRAERKMTFPRKGKGFRGGRQRDGELGEGGLHGVAVGEELSGRRDGWMG